MRTTQLLCVCCLFMTSAATECKGDSSCPAGKDSATLLQNIIQLAPAPAPPSAPASPLPSSPSTASWDGVDGPDDGAAAGDQGDAPASPLPSSPSTASWDGVDGPDDGAAAGDQGDADADAGAADAGADGAGAGAGQNAGAGAGAGGDDDGDGPSQSDSSSKDTGELPPGQTTTGYSASSCASTDCATCQKCFNDLVADVNWIATCRGGEGLPEAEICGYEDACLKRAAEKVKTCVDKELNKPSEYPTANTGNCLMKFMCDDKVAARCDYPGSTAKNWHGMNCPVSGSLTQMTANTSSSSASPLERTLRGEQKQSAEQGASLDDSPSGLTMKQRSLMQSSSGQEDKKALDESLNDKCVE